MTYRGRIEKGKVVLDESVQIPEGSVVTIVVVPQLQDTNSAEEGPTLLERLKNFKGTAKNMPCDASQNVDHYLYGLPKK